MNKVITLEVTKLGEDSYLFEVVHPKGYTLGTPKEIRGFDLVMERVNFFKEFYRVLDVSTKTIFTGDL